jgi:hypothetical protein
MIFQHIFYALKGVDILSMMEKLYKIKVTCIANNVAITLFDTKTPKLFCNMQRHRVLRGNTSYFDQISSHTDWADLASVIKMRLQETLPKFKRAHSAFIEQSVPIGSCSHSLVQAVLTEVAGWIIRFIQFVGEYY